MSRRRMILLSGLLALAALDATAAAPSAPAEEPVQPPNKVCLDGLKAGKVDFITWEARGVRSGVRVLGPLGAVRLVPREKGQPVAGGVVMDCELARAILDAAPVFKGLGVEDLLYSGTYQYRTRRNSKKLSEHAHGLAVDVHGFRLADGRVVDVRLEYERDADGWAELEQEPCIGAPQTEAGRLMRTLACRLRASSAFRAIITPDDDADHEDHMHLEAFPDAFTRASRVLSRRSRAPIDD